MKSTFWCVHCYPPYCYFHFYPSFHCLQRCSPCCCFHSFPTCCCYFHCHWPWCCFHCFQPCCCCFHFLLSLLWLTTTHLSCYLVPCLSDWYSDIITFHVWDVFVMLPLDGAAGWHVLNICLGLGGQLQSLNVENQPSGRILLNPLNVFSFQTYLDLSKTLALVFLDLSWVVCSHDHPCWCWPARRATLSNVPGQFLKASYLFLKLGELVQ